MHVEVRDDGAGFDPPWTPPASVCSGMRERVELLDGTLRIDSAPGAGATVRASFPVQRREAALRPPYARFTAGEDLGIRTE